ncbi:uncharacterized protein EI90DRAFT_3037898 [Cantharellus anzutake]|uniref:uncharacterized protein n=1 Tax=Cantharellus anzutake TaxID=1750568 RepID=UPI001902F1BF|nr:uncharacterized protein EI90DRAFT_3037898 [Cantharellus anzutake]KAF8339824.1 hypothetical protein EI90DRAFT_3037898 [Cantharellus anzutake]
MRFEKNADRDMEIVTLHEDEDEDDGRSKGQEREGERKRGCAIVKGAMASWLQRVVNAIAIVAKTDSGSLPVRSRRASAGICISLASYWVT